MVAYIVKGRDSFGDNSKVFEDKKQALATAVAWTSEGYLEVRIVRGSRIYTP